MKTPTLFQEICPTTSLEWMKNGALLIDVREKEEVAEIAFNVPNSLHIPLSEFEEKYTQIPKDKKIVLACKSGGRSLRATAFLINNGYPSDRVVNMKFGLSRWIEKGFPVKGDPELLKKNNLCCSSDGCC